MSDDLHRRVAELEATVRGLTQELVEANDRINQLETKAADASTESTPAPDPAESGTPDEDTEDSDLDDIIVA